MDLMQQNNNNKSYDLLPFLQDIVDKKSRFELPFAVGEDAGGNDLIYGLEKCPHLLVAGTTGSGKSVFLNNLILSVIATNHARLFLVDPKRVEFTQYKNIDRLVCDVATDAKDALINLKRLWLETQERYKKLESASCRNIEEYNALYPDCEMSYIVAVIDEISDLFLQNRSIEEYVIKIAQISRAAGIHLVIATQRPDSKTLSGLIRANFPSRVCFKVQNAANSRIILDCKGGEQLRGNGDGLIFPTGFNSPIRFQAPIISATDQNLIIKKISM